MTEKTSLTKTQVLSKKMDAISDQLLRQDVDTPEWEALFNQLMAIARMFRAELKKC